MEVARVGPKGRGQRRSQEGASITGVSRVEGSSKEPRVVCMIQ